MCFLNMCENNKKSIFVERMEYLLIKYTNFGSPFNTQTNFFYLLNTQTFEIHRFNPLL